MAGSNERRIMPVNISGKQYITVAERVTALHEDIKEGNIKKVSIITEKLSDNPVVFRATITIDDDIYTGTSGANPNKAIEKASPYEVAETSAVGRALGFAGYGSVESISSADEVIKAKVAPIDTELSRLMQSTPDVNDSVENGGQCKKCKAKGFNTILTEKKYNDDGSIWWGCLNFKQH